MFQKLVDPQVHNTLITDIVTLFADDSVSEIDDSLTEGQLQPSLQPPDALPVMLQRCIVGTYSRGLHACLLSH